MTHEDEVTKKKTKQKKKEKKQWKTKKEIIELGGGG